jgi:hypothetical protein
MPTRRRALDDWEQGFHCGLPLRRGVLLLRQCRNAFTGIKQSQQRAALAVGNGLVECAGLGHPMLKDFACKDICSRAQLRL